jgi:filamentous hemagglutinin family protein
MKRFVYLLKQSLMRLTTALVVAELCIPAIPLRAADITIDTSVPVNQRPTLDRAQNGVTIINLSRTTAGGVSVNRFTEYNVDANGIILNNSANMGVSVLGGAIYGNPNYQSDGREASIVVNEVTGSKRTDLLGYTEMFGKSAEYILVNPNGIMCNGAGFINMPRVTLGTGRAMYDGNGFSGIDVRGGIVSVEGKGIDAGKVDYFTIVTRMASLKGGIWGKDVNITTGTGTYNYRNKSFTQEDTGTEKPEMSIDASVLGSIYAGRIVIVSNENGVGVKSNADMLADVSDISISADGSIELKNTQAAGNIQVASTSDRIIQRGDAFAMGNISYRGKGFTNRGNVQAVKSISVEGLIDNQKGVITANENIDLNTGGTLSNDGGHIILAGDTGRIRIYGNDSLTIHGGDIKSAGAIDIDMSGNVVLAAGTSSIYADKNLNVKGLSLTNNMNLSMNGSINVNASGDIVNDSGSAIVSNRGTVLTSGGRITNSGVISGESVNVSAESLDNNANAEITGGSSNSFVSITGVITNSGRISGASDISVSASTITNTDSNSEISSGSKLTVEADTLQNNGGLLFSAGDMNIKAKTLNNIRGTLYSMGNMVFEGKETSGNSIYNYSGYIESEGDLTADIGSDGKLENTGKDSGSYTSELQTVGGYGDEHYAPMKRWKLTSTMTTDSSFLVSGGDMTIKAGEVKNHGSVISSVNNLTIDADKVINETNSQNVYLAHYQYEGKREEHRKKWYKGWKKYHDYHERWTSGTVRVVSKDTAVIQGKNVDINAGSVFNGNSADYNPAVTYNNGDAIKSSLYDAAAVKKSGKAGTTAYTPTAIEDVKNTGAIDLAKYINTSTGNPLFTIDKDPSSRYLMETRSQYVDVSKLKGSEYLLERINYNPEKDLRFLGDAFYEQQLVSKAILKATSRRYLEASIQSDQDQMAWLLDNAASAYRDLNLAVGVALTKEQINQLQQPIIWYVEDVVMGVKVLVPRVYIPEHILDGFSTDSGSVIAGNSVKIKAEDSVYNSGAISGTDTVSIAAVNNITNSGGTIKSGGDLSLSTENGDIINETQVYSTDNGHGYVTSELGRTGTIESGGNLTVSSGGNFTNRGADVKAGGDASITAAGNIDFETVSVHNVGYSEQYGTSGVSDTTNVTGSALTVGGNLSMNSGRDINFIGSSADIAGNADVNTGGNFNLINDYNTSHYEGSKSKSGAFSSSTTTVVSDTKTVVGSSFNTGGDLNVDSGNDINIVGSDVNAGGNASLNAAGTQNIIAVHDESYFSKETTKSGLGAGGSLYGSEKRTDMVYDKTVNGSEVDIKGKYASNSGGDTNITGSSITAGEAEITTGGNLNITAAYNEHAEEHKTETTGFGTSGGDLFSMEVDANGKGSTTAVASTLNIGTLTVKSGNDVYVEGSTINAGSADINAEGNFTETSATETSYEYSIHEKITGNINLNVIVHPLSEIDYNNGRLSATVASGEYDKHETRADTTSKKSSNINIENDININSGKDITVSGSNLATNTGDISLTAVDNVNIIAAYDKSKTSDSETKGTIDLSVGAKNAATDVYYAGKAVKDAEKALADAKSSYEDFDKQLAKAKDNVDKGLMDQADYDMMESEKHYYEANVALCTENLAAKTAAFLQAMAGAASSSGVLGFSADAQIDIDALVRKTMSENVSAVSSTITSGGSLTINAGKKADIIGSDVSAGDTIALNAETVDIEAAKNTSSSTTSESNAHVTITFSTSTGAGINASASDTESCTDSISYTNSHLNAANIIINSTADTTVKGGVVTAENSLKLDIGGDLTVESLQDTSHDSSHTVGVSGGYGKSGGNIGENFNMSNGSSKWVNEQTSLTGGSVNIYVEDKTTLKGAVIASTDNDLNLDTGSVEYSNIFDSKKSTSIGGGVSGSGIGSTNGVSSSANINYSLSNSTQVNIATIGEGNITVRDGGSTDKLNRDTTATQIMTSDTGMKGGATVDSDTINLLTTNPVTSVDNAIDSAAGIAFKAITDGANVVNDTMVVAEKTGNWIEYGDFEVAGDLKMTQEEYKEWQVYKQFEKKSGVDVDFSIDGVIVSEKDVKVSNIIRDLDRIQEYNDSDKVDILGNMSKEPLSPTHGEDAQIWIWATYPYYLSGKKHSGVDLGTVINSKVTAISGGTAVVHYTGEYNGKGINNVTITDSGGNSVIYKHTTYSNTISNGQWIDSGKIIGTLDKSGQAAGLWNGSHLHLQVDNKKGSNSNPLYYIFKNQPNLKWNFPSKKVEQDIKTTNPELYDSIKKYGTGEKGL